MVMNPNQMCLKKYKRFSRRAAASVAAVGTSVGLLLGITAVGTPPVGALPVVNSVNPTVHLEAVAVPTTMSMLPTIWTYPASPVGQDPTANVGVEVTANGEPVTQGTVTFRWTNDSTGVGWDTSTSFDSQGRAGAFFDWYWEGAIGTVNTLQVAYSGYNAGFIQYEPSSVLETCYDILSPFCLPQ
jgi:hypothetical protein